MVGRTEEYHLAFERCIDMIRSLGEKRVFALRKARPGGRNTMVCGDGERALEMCNRREFGADFSWSEQI